MAAANVIAWPEHPAGPDGSVNEEAAWLRDGMSQICDASMPRAMPMKPRQQVDGGNSTS